MRRPRVRAAAILGLCLWWGGAGCQSDAKSERVAVQPRDLKPQADSAPAEASAPQTFGTPSSDPAAAVTMAALLEDPASYEGQRIQTHGRVAQVCQRMGCWLELKDEQAGNLRVPMAGHAFFVPRTLIGKMASVEGEVVVRALTAEQREHYRSEGMEATTQAVSLHATSVQVAAQ